MPKLLERGGRPADARSYIMTKDGRKPVKTVAELAEEKRQAAKKTAAKPVKEAK